MPKLLVVVRVANGTRWTKNPEPLIDAIVIGLVRNTVLRVRLLQADASGSFLQFSSDKLHA